MNNELLLPEGTHAIHIGPHKTGTTFIQSSFNHSRDLIEPYGVHYAGKKGATHHAAVSVGGRRAHEPGTGLSEAVWQRLVKNVKKAGDKRVLISSEFYADANDDKIPRVIDELGVDHVIVTLRPLDKILPSQWQQYVKNRLRVPWENWLLGMLNEPPYDKPTPTFWRRHRHGELVKRWAEVVGADNVTVLVGQSDPLFINHTFEAMLGLPEDTLRIPEGRDNRSLTLNEIELIRLLNMQYVEQEWPTATYSRMVRYGVVLAMQARKPDATDNRIVLPPWARDLLAEVSEEQVKTIRDLGVRVVGDLDDLLVERSAPDAQPKDVPAKIARPERFNPASGAELVTTQAAVTSVIGAIQAQVTFDLGELAKAEPGTLAPSVNTTPTVDLIRVVLGRLRTRLMFWRERP